MHTRRLPSPGRIVSAVVIVVIAVVAIVLLTQKSDTHDLVAYFESATNLVPGAKVTAGGVQVGSVGSVTLDQSDGQAAVALNISDQDFWPLHTGTKAEIRWGGTVSYSNRYVELIPGPAGDPLLSDGAKLPTSSTITPVEFDQLFNVFSANTRRSISGLIAHGATTFGGRASAMHNGLEASPPALNAVSGVLADLGEDPNALETLIGTGASTASALRSQQTQLVNLVTQAAATFQTISDNAHNTQLTLSKLPPALSSAQTALNQLNPSLTKLNTLVDEIRPGATQLRLLAAPLAASLTTLHSVAPQLNSTLVDVQNGAPRVTTFLNTAKPVLTSARSTLTTFEPMAACVLPYGPDLAGFVETWDSFISPYNSQGHYAKALAQVFPAPNDQTETPAQLTSHIAGLGYALIRPPGYSAGQTWYQTSCGDTVAGLTASDDPEDP